MGVLLLAWCAVLLLCQLHAHADELLGVVLISRHGTRASNPTVSVLCPNDQANLDAYSKLGLSPGGLTGKGMMELFELGRFTKQRYTGQNKLLPDVFNTENLRVQAVNEERTLQSAIAWGQALFPATTAPEGYLQSLPVPIAVYSTSVGFDNLLESRSAACHARLQSDVEEWDATVGAALFARHASLVQRMSTLCGYDLHQALNLGNAVKDITDAITFDYFSGLPPLPGLELEDLAAFRALAVQNLFGRLYRSEKQLTYLAGELPVHLANFFSELSTGFAVDAPAAKFQAFHGHREMMYAMAFFLNVTLSLESPGTPRGAIPPATTFFLELKNGSEGLYVDFLLWHPCNEAADPASWPGSMGYCEPTLLPMGDCPLHCPLPQFRALIEHRIKRTGSWQQLCQDHPPTATKTLPIFEHVSAPIWWLWPGLLAVAVSAGMAVGCVLKRRHDYIELP